MNKKIYLVIAIIFICLCLIFAFGKKKDKGTANVITNIVSNTIVDEPIKTSVIKKSLGAKKCEEIEDENIKELITEHNESYYLVKNEWYPTEKYLVFDINDDNQMECLVIYDETLYLYQLVDGEVEIAFSKDAENGILGFFELYNRENKNIEVLIVDYFADGLCYENCIYDLLRIEDDAVIFEKLGSYACDIEKEAELRAAIENDPNLSMEEKDDKIVDAHTLKFIVAGEEVSETEFDEFEEGLRTKYSVRNKSFEDSILFD